MRVNIKTNGPVKDNDIRALYLINEAMRISSERMRAVNIRTIAAKFKVPIDTGA